MDDIALMEMCSVFALLIKEDSSLRLKHKDEQRLSLAFNRAVGHESWTLCRCVEKLLGVSLCRCVG